MFLGVCLSEADVDTFSGYDEPHPELVDILPRVAGDVQQRVLVGSSLALTVVLPAPAYPQDLETQRHMHGFWWGFMWQIPSSTVSLHVEWLVIGLKRPAFYSRYRLVQ